ncbi:PAS domain protein [Methyloligella halotolerans]|uniref:PAS domain protein n=1 Tax=Methyloligella halotolerans TaxID=1177755 RepID=A0A1E2RXA8_9HYPH|nr:PAS domain-containing protein [Methyloligella halotolerans]ODA66876.1 PAS domain protein [Methyloligella halotolerans]
MDGDGFREQLVISGQRELFDYWNALSGSGTIPNRSDFDPQRIPRLLPNICLIDVKGGLAGSRFRLAGTALRNIYGAELTGSRLETVFQGRPAEYWRRIHGAVIEQGAAQSGVVRGPVKDRGHVVMYWLRLPLLLDGPDVRFILGHDFAAQAPLESKTDSDVAGEVQGELPLRYRFPPRGACA